MTCDQSDSLLQPSLSFFFSTNLLQNGQSGSFFSTKFAVFELTTFWVKIVNISR